MTRDETLAFLRRYLASVESGQPSEGFYEPDVVLTEHPNRFSPNGAVRTLSDIAAAAEKGKAILRSQAFEIVSAIIDGDRAALQLTWTGVTAIPMGALAAGATLKAHFAQFYEFRNDRIWRQATYDCIEPF